MYTFKGRQELLWFVGVTLATAILQVLVAFDPEEITNWQSWATATGAGLVRTVAAALLSRQVRGDAMRFALTAIVLGIAIFASLFTITKAHSPWDEYFYTGSGGNLFTYEGAYVDSYGYCCNAIRQQLKGRSPGSYNDALMPVSNPKTIVVWEWDASQQRWTRSFDPKVPNAVNTLTEMHRNQDNPWISYWIKVTTNFDWHSMTP